MFSHIRRLQSAVRVAVTNPAWPTSWSNSSAVRRGELAAACLQSDPASDPLTGAMLGMDGTAAANVAGSDEEVMGSLDPKGAQANAIGKEGMSPRSIDDGAVAGDRRCAVSAAAR